MRSVRPAKETVFKLVFSADEHRGVLVKAFGRIAADSQSIHLCYGKNRQLIGWSRPPNFIIQTLGRPMVPLYAREIGGEVWISNDIAALLIDNEVVPVRLVEMLYAATGTDGPKSVLSHLLQDIVFLMPSSLYEIGADETGKLICTWTDLVFSPQTLSRQQFLDSLREQCAARFAGDDAICLALTGGYDSRFELGVLRSLGKKIHGFHFERYRAERLLAAEVAAAAGASFHYVPYDDAAERGWHFLGEQGYCTRWDGCFSPGALPTAGLYTEMARLYPDLPKQMFPNGQWKGRFYAEAADIFGHWDRVEDALARDTCDAFPDYANSINAERDRRKEFGGVLASKIRQKTDDETLIADLAVGFHHSAKVGARTAFLFENGMPVFTGEQANRERFISLPREHKESFLTWSIERLDKRLASLPWNSSSHDRVKRWLGPYNDFPGARIRARRYLRFEDETRRNWPAPDDGEAIMAQLPEISDVVDLASQPKTWMSLAMIFRFLRMLQDRKGVTFRIVH